MKTKTCIFAGANFIITCIPLSMHLVLGHISLPSQSVLEARDVTKILITQPYFLNLYCKIQTLTFSAQIYDLHPRAEKSRSIFILHVQHGLQLEVFRSYNTYLSQMGPDSTGPFTALHMESTIMRPSGCRRSLSVSLHRYLSQTMTKIWR